jgi:hypothetical protein
MKIVTITAFLISLTTLVASDAPTVPYPAQYRTWTHLHASFIGGKLPGFWTPACEKPCTAGIFHFYGNSQAMEGLRTGTYPDGAIIAEELLEVLGHDNGSGKEGTRHFVGVMVKDSNLYSETGGWGFGKFDTGSKVNSLDSKAQKDCFTCHIPRKDKGYVFTEYQER